MTPTSTNSVGSLAKLLRLDQKHAALELLLEGYVYAKGIRQCIWDFAVEIDALCSAGLSRSDLRWLILRGYVDHAAEVIQEAGPGRTFRGTGNLTFTSTTCFVLTEQGAAQLCQPPEAAGHVDSFVPENCQPVLEAEHQLLPRWDIALRVLRVGSILIKHFKQPAPNQEVVLASFEEEGWPVRIDNPISPSSERCAQQCLHDTINSLNRYQKSRLIRFHGDGTGQGICWQLNLETLTKASSEPHQSVS